MSHFPGGPSGAARRIQCPASVMLEQQFPDVEDDHAAREGEAFHWACAERLRGAQVAEGQVAPNNFVLDEDMVEAADEVYNDIADMLAPYGLKPEQGQSEKPVKIDRVYPGMFGTPDYYCWVDLGGGGRYLLLLWDFKYGRRYVEVFENPQLVDYVAGITQGLNDLQTPVEIVATIYQPRAFHGDGSIRRWRTTLLDLRALINISSTAAHEAYGATPRARVGPECRDCKARHSCSTFTAAVYDALHEADRTTPLQMTPVQMAQERRIVADALQVLEARLAGLEAQLTVELRAGRAVPGLRLEHGYGRERWNASPTAVIAMGEGFGLNLAKPIAAVTPKQARDLGMNPELVSALSTRPRAAATLVEDKGVKWRKVFGSS